MRGIAFSNLKIAQAMDGNPAEACKIPLVQTQLLPTMLDQQTYLL